MPPTPQWLAERRAAYAAELAQGTDRFHEPRREDCPWCGSKRLRTRLRTSDLVQRKPGTFVVDECGDCAHAFQNPRLTAEGLAFYHRDLHGGAHEGLVERLLGARGSRGRHRAAARAMLPYAEPESWLDVGTGHGHFPAVAKEVHPYTAFDGLDATRRVEKARAAGRVEEAHRGRLTDPRTAERLRARYDVVSMFHHLEHTPTRARNCAPPWRSCGPAGTSSSKSRTPTACSAHCWASGGCRTASRATSTSCRCPTCWANWSPSAARSSRRTAANRISPTISPAPSPWRSAASCPTSTRPGGPPRRARSSAPSTRP